jgi:O-antigen/teichoic acid export membrane protein
MRRTLAHAAAAGVALAALYGVLLALLWWLLPSVLQLAPEDRAAIVRPLALLAVLSAATMPLRVFPAALAGLQDATFNGVTGLVQWTLNIGLTIGLLFSGFGLYALALAATLPPLVTVAASLVRVRILAPDLLRGWPWPTVAGISRLFGEGIGSWLGAWGWRLLAASDGIVVAALGHPSYVAVLACSTRLADMLMQMSWVPADSGLIGLTQLAAEGGRARARGAAVALLRVSVGLAGAVTCLVLAVNPAFVRAWVGPDLFAGRMVNGAVAAALLAVSFGHVIAAISSALGHRLRVGLATIAAGAVHILLAIVLTDRFGLFGLVSAEIVSHLGVFVPIVLPLMARVCLLSPKAVVAEVLAPWVVRWAPFAVAAAAVGAFLPALPLWAIVPIGALVGAASLWQVRALYLELPPVVALTERLTRLRLMVLGRGA